MSFKLPLSKSQLSTIYNAYGTAKSLISGARNSFSGAAGTETDLANSYAAAELSLHYDPSRHYTICIQSTDPDPTDMGGDGSPLRVTGYLSQEQFGFGFGSEYEQPFSGGLLKMAGMNGMDTAARALGFTAVTKGLTSQVWSSSSHLSLTLNLTFFAQSPAKDQMVQEQIRKLALMTLPTEEPTKFLRAPGPRPDIQQIYTEGMTAASDIGSSFDQSMKNLSGGLDGITESATSAFKNGVQALSPLGGALGRANASIDSALRNPKGAITVTIGGFLWLPVVVIKNVSPTYQWMTDQNGNPMYMDVEIQLETYQMVTANDFAGPRSILHPNGAPEAAPGAKFKEISDGIASRWGAGL